MRAYLQVNRLLQESTPVSPNATNIVESPQWSYFRTKGNCRELLVLGIGANETIVATLVHTFDGRLLVFTWITTELIEI